MNPDDITQDPPKWPPSDRLRHKRKWLFEGPDSLTEAQKRYQESIRLDAPVGHLITVDGSNSTNEVFAEIVFELQRHLGKRTAEEESDPELT